MARLIERFISEPRGCSYLPEESASLEYRVMIDVDPGEWDDLLERGWRRFGVAYFRPRCLACSECVPLRIPLDRFAPSRNQRRVEKKAAAIRHVMGVPRIDEARLALYRRWYAMQSSARGWDGEQMTAERYFHEFAFPHPSAREISYWDDSPSAGGSSRLIAVAITDETPRAMSAVYTYHDPDYRDHSLGTASILRQARIAREAGKRWLYLGYRVMGCPSSEYKARFKPHELLAGWVETNQQPRWRFIDK